MRTGKEIRRLWRKMYSAKREFVDTVAQNLKEIGDELKTVDDFEDSEKLSGVHVNCVNGIGEFSRCTVDRVRFETDTPVTRIGFHVCYENGLEKDYWAINSDFDTESETYVLLCIVWPDDDE